MICKKFLINCLIYISFFCNCPLGVTSEIEEKEFDDSRKRLLSIDGGGIRGLIPALVLEYLETTLAQGLSSDKFQYDIHIADFFDLFAGTSTGSILSLALLVPDEFDQNRPRYSASKLVELYEIKGKDIFPPAWWRGIRSVFKPKYKAEALENILQEYFQSYTLGHAVHEIPVFVPTYDIANNEEFYFDTYPGSKEEMKHYKMWLAARASSAAPTFFPALKMGEWEFVDGGVFMNNPTLGAYGRAKQTFSKDKFTIISLGTGEAIKENLKDSQITKHLENAGKLGWASPASSVMMKGAVRATEKIMDCFKDAEGRALYYQRFQEKLEEAVLDKVDAHSMQELKGAAEKIKASEEFKELLTKLKKVHNAQAEDLTKKLENLNNAKIIIGDLSRYNISGKFIDTLSNLLKSSNVITHLNLTHCRINAQSLKEFCEALKSNNTLNSLNLSHNGIGYLGVSYLGDLLEKNSTLKALILQSNGIDERARKEMGTLVRKELHPSTPTSLTFLDISHNRLKNQNFVEFLNSFKTLSNSNLKVVDLSHNHIGDGIIVAEGPVASSKGWNIDALNTFTLSLSPQLSTIQFLLSHNNFKGDSDEIQKFFKEKFENFQF